MYPGLHADGVYVFRPQPNAREVSRRVARLPLDYFVSRLAEHWIVVGPTGIFVVGRSGEDTAVTAEHTVALAHRLRALLSDVIPWVPFIDALVVGGDEELSLPCTVVDIGSLEMALLSGPVAIDDLGVVQLRESLPGVLAGIDTAEVRTVVDPTRPLDPA